MHLTRSAGSRNLMRCRIDQFLRLLVLLLLPIAATAEDMMIETFEVQPETRWRFSTDGVMGGVSKGEVTFLKEDGHSFARLTGRISTENNCGFIQVRMDLPEGAPEGTTGVRLIVRGNDQQYFVHLRTSGTVLPWQYYQAGLEVSGTWTELRLPFGLFRRSGRLLRDVPRADSLKSVAVVAYGRNHEAKIDVRELGFY